MPCLLKRADLLENPSPTANRLMKSRALAWARNGKASAPASSTPAGGLKPSTTTQRKSDGEPFFELDVEFVQPKGNDHENPWNPVRSDIDAGRGARRRCR